MTKKHRREKIQHRSIARKRKDKVKNRTDLKFDFRIKSVSENWDTRKTLKQYYLL